MIGISGSGPFGVEAQICWFGQPAQASPLPACSDSGPGQCSRRKTCQSDIALRWSMHLSHTWLWCDEFRFDLWW